MYKLIIFYCILLSIGLSACKEKSTTLYLKDSDHLKLVDSIHLDFEMTPSETFILSAFEMNQVNYISIYRGYKSTSTRHQVDIFSDDGVFRKKIYLDTLNSEIFDSQHPLDFDFLSPSEFYCIVNDYVLKFNGDGKVTWSKEIKSLKNHLGVKGLGANHLGEFFFAGDSSLILNIIDYPKRYSTETCEDFIDNNMVFQKQPKMLIINNIFADSLEYRLVLNDMYEGLIDKFHMERRPRTNVYADGRIFGMLEHSDVLRVFNDSLEKIQEIKVVADSIPVGVLPSEICDTSTNIHFYFFEQYKKSLVLNLAYYEKNSGITMVHLNSARNKLTENYPSFILYDSEGEKIEEIYVGPKEWLRFIQLNNRFYDKEGNSIHIYELN